ncbi:hypothetical protein Dimus_015283 [Dionaea muscipula]
MRAAIDGESGSGEKFFDARVEVEEPRDERLTAVHCTIHGSAKVTEPSESTPRVVSLVIFRKTVMNKLLGEFERARTADLEKARVENVVSPNYTIHDSSAAIGPLDGLFMLDKLLCDWAAYDGFFIGATRIA